MPRQAAFLNHTRSITSRRILAERGKTRRNSPNDRGERKTSRFSRFCNARGLEEANQTSPRERARELSHGLLDLRTPPPFSPKEALSDTATFYFFTGKYQYKGIAESGGGENNV
ncbi:MAG TPA: hypothetical protein VN715_01780 [Roseiarcus sp.]|nr:hypothetical protein [Roseiarcus sp.]